MTSTVPLPAHLEDAVRSEASLRRFLHGLPGVDPVGVEQRAAALATRSIKKASKLAAIDLAISMVDLTTLEGADTPGKVRTLAPQGAAGPIRTIPDDPARRGASASIPTWCRVAVEVVPAAASGSPRWQRRSRPAGPAGGQARRHRGRGRRPGPPRSTW